MLLHMKAKGAVIRGKRRGTELGFPTVNIAFENATESGVYAARVTFKGKTYSAAAFADPSRSLLEAYLLDFKGDLYDMTIEIELLEKIRDSKVFSSDDELRSAIVADIAAIRTYFAQ